MDKLRCQAFLMTPEVRNWKKYSQTPDYRCRFPAKPESSFCGVHAKLGLIIDKIVWKERYDDPSE